MRGFFIAVSSFFKVFPVIHKYGIWSFYYLPLILNVLLLVLYYWGIGILFSWGTHNIVDSLFEWIGLNETSWWYSVITIFVSIVEWFSRKLIILYTFQFVSLVFLAPLYSIISETLLNHLNDTHRPFTFIQLLKDVKRGVLVAFRNVVLQMFYSIPVFILSFFFPVFGILLFLISAYFYGFALMDYRSEYYNYSFKDSVRIIRQNRWYAVGLGTMFNLLMLLGSLIHIEFITILYVPVISIVAAILGMERMLGGGNNNISG